jgi:hypothetical protein
VWLGVLFALLAGLAAAGFFAHGHASSEGKPSPGSGIVGHTAIAKNPQSFSELLALKPSELAGVDIALVNLLCAERLPGAEDLRIQPCLDTLDQWAKWVDSETKRHFYRFQRNPAKFNNSEGYFRVLMLITVLQQDFKVRYNPARIAPPESPEPDAAFFADSKDLFLHGIAGSRAMGTCISMPAFYVAIGRRLGYPMKLVTARDHLFARWEGADDKERFNIEGTNQGLNTPEDDFYRKWPYPITEEEIRSGYYLKSLTPAEELAIFLQTRGHCLRVAGFFGEARAAYLQAQALVPQWPENQVFLALINRKMAPRPISRAEQDAMADYANAMNQFNRQMMQTRGQPQPEVSPVMPPAPPVTFKP